MRSVWSRGSMAFGFLFLFFFFFFLSPQTIEANIPFWFSTEVALCSKQTNRQKKTHKTTNNLDILCVLKGFSFLQPTLWGFLFCIFLANCKLLHVSYDSSHLQELKLNLSFYCCFLVLLLLMTLWKLPSWVIFCWRGDSIADLIALFRVMMHHLVS